MSANEVVIFIDSAKRTSGTSESFTVSVPKEYFLRGVKRIKILDVMIPHSWYSFTSSNNKVTFSEPAGADTNPVTFSISTGSVYNGSTLATALQALFIANSPNSFAYTVTFDVVVGSQKLVITSTGPNNLNLDFTASDAAYAILGFNQATFTGAQAYTAPNMINFVTDKYINILSPELVPGLDAGLIAFDGSLSPTGNNILKAVPICAAPTQMLHYCESSLMPWTSVIHGSFAQQTGTDRNLSFSLTFPSGSVLSLNGHNWCMNVIFSFDA